MGKNNCERKYYVDLEMNSLKPCHAIMEVTAEGAKCTKNKDVGLFKSDIFAPNKKFSIWVSPRKL